MEIHDKKYLNSELAARALCIYGCALPINEVATFAMIASCWWSDTANIKYISSCSFQPVPWTNMMWIYNISEEKLIVLEAALAMSSYIMLKMKVSDFDSYIMHLATLHCSFITQWPMNTEFCCNIMRIEIIKNVNFMKRTSLLKEQCSKPYAGRWHHHFLAHSQRDRDIRVPLPSLCSHWSILHWHSQQTLEKITKCDLIIYRSF